MAKVQMTIQIDPDLLQKFRVYAVTHKQTMTELITEQIKKICFVSNINDTLNQGVTDEMQPMRQEV